MTLEEIADEILRKYSLGHQAAPIRLALLAASREAERRGWERCREAAAKAMEAEESRLLELADQDGIPKHHADDFVTHAERTSYNAGIIRKLEYNE